MNKDKQELRLLLVDDEEIFLETAAKVFRRKGVTVLTANRGTKALDILASTPVDAIILDVKMPGLDGITTLKRILSICPKAKVILLTGHATTESAAEGMQYGAVGYMVKPADLDELLDKAKQACGHG